MKIKTLQIEGIDAQTLISNIEELLEEKISKFSKNNNTIPSITYLTRKEVGDLFKVSLVTIHSWTNKGLLKSYRIGNKVRYKRHEIEQALVEIHKKR